MMVVQIPEHFVINAMAALGVTVKYDGYDDVYDSELGREFQRARYKVKMRGKEIGSYTNVGPGAWMHSRSARVYDSAIDAAVRLVFGELPYVDSLTPETENEDEELV